MADDEPITEVSIAIKENGQNKITNTKVQDEALVQSFSHRGDSIDERDTRSQLQLNRTFEFETRHQNSPFRRFSLLSLTMLLIQRMR